MARKVNLSFLQTKLRKVCYEVCFCEKFQRRSCSTTRQPALIFPTS